MTNWPEVLKKHASDLRPLNKAKRRGSFLITNRELNLMLPAMRHKYFLNGWDFRITPVTKPSQDRTNFVPRYWRVWAKQWLTRKMAKQMSNWVIHLKTLLDRHSIEFDHSPVTPWHLNGLLSMVNNELITNTIAKMTLEEMVKTGHGPLNVVMDNGWLNQSTEDSLTKVIKKVIADHPKEVEKYRAGKKQVFGFFMGKIMGATNKTANAKEAQKILGDLLNR